MRARNREAFTFAGSCLAALVGCVLLGFGQTVGVLVLGFLFILVAILGALNV